VALEDQVALTPPYPVKLIVEPTHTLAGPVIPLGVVLTDTTAVVTHPPTIYEIVAVPRLLPVTIPVVLLTTATPALLDDHVPPVVALLRVVAEPTQTLITPVIGAIAALTVMVLDVEQPPAVYVMEATPADRPVIPGIPTETTPVGLEVHTPPMGLAVNVLLVPTQTMELPTVVTGIGLTVSTFTAAHPDGIT
jgi:hypothetical protein